MIPAAAVAAQVATTAVPAGLSVMASAISALYGVGSSLNDFLDRHIEDMKASANTTISRTGHILEMAKFGFGLGYVSSVIVIAVGQLLLGNTLAALSTVATAATLSNPIAMTCAAVGAILYGWKALSDKERDDLLERLAKGVEVGVQLIKAVIRFVMDTAKELLGSKPSKAFKEYVAQTVGVFGRRFSDVTRSAADTVIDTVSTAREQTQRAIESTVKLTTGVTEKVMETASDATRSAGQALDAVTSVVKNAGRGKAAKAETAAIGYDAPKER